MNMTSLPLPADHPAKRALDTDVSVLRASLLAGFLGYLASGFALAWWTGMDFHHVLTWLAVAFWPLVVFCKVAYLIIQVMCLFAVTTGTMWAVYALLNWCRWQPSRLRYKFKGNQTV